MNQALTYDHPPILCLIRRTLLLPGPLPTYPIPLTLEPEVPLPPLSTCSTAPFAEVQRARLLLRAPQQPPGRHAEIARPVGCCVNTVKHGRQRGLQTDSVREAPRAGTRRTFPPLQRAQMTALACRAPRVHGNPWPRWAGEKRAPVAVAQQSMEPIAPGTIRPWLRADKINPWRYHSGQHAPAPPWVDTATPVLDLYAHAQAWAARGAAVVCRDEQTSLPARQRVSATTAAAPGSPVHVADRYKRRGAVHLCWALVVASGRTLARTRSGRKLADCKAFLGAWFPRARCTGLQGVQLMLDHGSPHAPQQRGSWMASLAWACAVRLDGLPTHASWLEQVEIIFSKVQRDVLPPNDVPSPLALEKQLQTYCDELDRHPKPMQWTYTKTKWLAKFGTSPPAELAA